MTLDERAKQAIDDKRFTRAEIDEARRVGILEDVLDGKLEVFIETMPERADEKLLTEDACDNEF